MARFIVRRLIAMVLVMFAISVLTFLIFNVIPNGDPAVRIAGRNSTETAVRAIREEWGFDKPVYVQYLTTMKKVFTGDLISYYNAPERGRGDPQGLPAHPGAGGGGGAAVDGRGGRCSDSGARVRAGKFADRFLTIIALIGISMPVFWLGRAGQLLPGVQVGALPQRRVRGVRARTRSSGPTT